MKPILKLNNISFSYISDSNPVTIIDSLSLEVFPGEIISIIGPEKCGKSTIFSIICGLLEPTSGYVSCYNTHIGYMVQNGALFQWHNLYRNFSKHYDNPPQTYKQNSAITSSKCCNCANSCKCCEKKASLIKVLASEPELLLLDEPFASFDYEARTCIRTDIINLIHLEHKSAIFISNNIDEALSISDRVLILSKMPCRIIKEFRTNDN